MRSTRYISILTLALAGLMASAGATPSVLDDLESYAVIGDAQAAGWNPYAAGGTTDLVDLSTDVDLASPGVQSIMMTGTYPNAAQWEEAVFEFNLAAPLSFQPDEALRFRFKAELTSGVWADEVNIYVQDPNFTWGPPENLSGSRASANPALVLDGQWHVVTLPQPQFTTVGGWLLGADMGNITRLVFECFTALGSPSGIPTVGTVWLDDIEIITNPSLLSLPEDFEKYADTTELQDAWNNGQWEFGTSDITLGNDGSQVLDWHIVSNGGTMAWANNWIQTSAFVAPFSIPPLHALAFRLKGDPAIDADVQFAMEAYDIGWPGILNVSRWYIPDYRDNTVWKDVYFTRNNAYLNDSYLATGDFDFDQISGWYIYMWAHKDGLAFNAFDAHVLFDDFRIVPDPSLVALPEGFETYADDAALQAKYVPWEGGGGVIDTVDVSLSNDVDPASVGTQSLDLHWGSSTGGGPWALAIFQLNIDSQVSVAADDVLSFRFKGDDTLDPAPQPMLVVDIFDLSGGAGRWWSALPTTSSLWQSETLSIGDITIMDEVWMGNGTLDLGAIVSIRFEVFADDGLTFGPFDSHVFFDDIFIGFVPVVPVVSSTDPPQGGAVIPGGVVPVTVTFNQAVAGVLAGDLSINYSGASIVADSATPDASGKTWTFGFSTWVNPPGPETLDVILDAGAIVNAVDAGLPFAGDSWTYQFVLTAPSATRDWMLYE